MKLLSWIILLGILFVASFGWTQTLTDPHYLNKRNRPALSPHQKPDHQFSIKAPQNLRIIPIITPTAPQLKNGETKKPVEKKEP